MTDNRKGGKLSAAQKMRRRKPLGEKSHFHNGYFDVSKSNKYNGELPVQFRSGLELKWFNIFEISEEILTWSSEPDLDIKYLFRESVCEYVVDAMYTKKLPEGNIITVLAEIKPYKQCMEPKPQQFSKYGNYEYEKERFERNYAKWKAAWNFCKEKGYAFVLLTEQNLPYD